MSSSSCSSCSILQGQNALTRAALTPCPSPGGRGETSYSPGRASIVADIEPLQLWIESSLP
jgi:hypothetical protein